MKQHQVNNRIMSLTSAMSFQRGEGVVVFEEDGGNFGLALAQTCPDSNVYITSDDVSHLRKVEGIVSKERERFANVEVLSEHSDLLRYRSSPLDAAVIVPGRFSGTYEITLRKLFQASDILKSDSAKIYLVTHKRLGGKGHERRITDIPGAQSQVLHRARGGFYILEVSIDHDLPRLEIPEVTKTIGFSLCEKTFHFETEPAIFSSDGLDEGTRLLLETVELGKYRRLLDVGCGWGAIGIIAGTFNPQAEVVMIDSNSRAITLTRRNASRLLPLVDWTAIATDSPMNVVGPFDLILSNPPFHQSDQRLVQLFSEIGAVAISRSRLVFVVEKSYGRKFRRITSAAFGVEATPITSHGGYEILQSIL